MIYVSTSSLGPYLEPDVIALVRKLNCGIEFGSDYAVTSSVLRKLKDDGIPILLHNYVPRPVIPFVLNMCSPDEEELERGIEMIYENLRVTSELGLEYYGFHAGYAFAMRPEMFGGQAVNGPGQLSKHTAEKVFAKNLSKALSKIRLSLRADALPMVLIENNVLDASNLRRNVYPGLLGVTADEIKRLIEHCRLYYPHVGLLLDVAHLSVSAKSLGFSRLEFIERVAPYVKALHLSENDQSTDSNEPFDDSAWFLPYARHLNSQGLPITIETQPVDMLNITNMVELLRG